MNRYGWWAIIVGLIATAAIAVADTRVTVTTASGNSLQMFSAYMPSASYADNTDFGRTYPGTAGTFDEVDVVVTAAGTGGGNLTVTATAVNAATSCAVTVACTQVAGGFACTGPNCAGQCTGAFAAGDQVRLSAAGCTTKPLFNATVRWR